MESKQQQYVPPPAPCRVHKDKYMPRTVSRRRKTEGDNKNNSHLAFILVPIKSPPPKKKENKKLLWTRKT